MNQKATKVDILVNTAVQASSLCFHFGRNYSHIWKVTSVIYVENDETTQMLTFGYSCTTSGVHFCDFWASN